VAKLLLVTGLLLAGVGSLWLLAERFGFATQLPGDIVIERPGLRIYVPLMTCLVVSVLLTLVFWLYGR
jgi:hypothetical protein